MVGTSLQTFSEGGRTERMLILSLFLDGMGFSLCNYFSLINLLVVCAILYILNYTASPQSNL